MSFKNVVVFIQVITMQFPSERLVFLKTVAAKFCYNNWLHDKVLYWKFLPAKKNKNKLN